jgi:hypothetical protein
MEFYKKILLAIVIIILTYILWHFIKRRQEILLKMENMQTNETNETNETNKNVIEGLSFGFGLPTQDAELATLKNKSLVTIKNTTLVDLPLIEYCIMGSYNSTFTGNYINADMIKYLLSRGCRFFDLEIYYILDQKTNAYSPHVGYSIDPTFTILASENTVLLDTILTTINNNAFISLNAQGGSPNNGDPIFINLRIKSSNTDVYDAVAKSIDAKLLNNLYSGEVTNKTKLSKIMGSIVIILDNTIDPNYAQYTNCKGKPQPCYDLTKYVNMESGGSELNITTYLPLTNQCTTPVTILDNMFNTDISRMKMAYPDLVPATTQNPVIKDFITKYNCQILPNRFYYNDANLAQYEKLFNQNKFAIVPIAMILQYYVKNPYTI